MFLPEIVYLYLYYTTWDQSWYSHIEYQTSRNWGCYNLLPHPRPRPHSVVVVRATMVVAAIFVNSLLSLKS